MENIGLANVFHEFVVFHNSSQRILGVEESEALGPHLPNHHFLFPLL